MCSVDEKGYNTAKVALGLLLLFVSVEMKVYSVLHCFKLAHEYREDFNVCYTVYYYSALFLYIIMDRHIEKSFRMW